MCTLTTLRLGVIFVRMYEKPLFFLQWTFDTNMCLITSRDFYP